MLEIYRISINSLEILEHYRPEFPVLIIYTFLEYFDSILKKMYKL